MSRRALAAGMGLLCAASAGACALSPGDGTAVVGDGVQLAWQLADGEAITPSGHFMLRVRLCPAGAELLAVDAVMPAHRHGMNYRPTLQPQGHGLWLAEGLLFHMRGTWELRFDVRVDGRLQGLRQAVELP